MADEKKVYFEQAPILSNLLLDLHREFDMGLAGVPMALQRLGFLAVLIIVKVFLPLALLFEYDAKTKEVLFSHRLIGSAGWTMVVLQIEEDRLRDIWWIVTTLNMRDVVPRGGFTDRKEFRKFAPSAKDLIYYGVSLCYNLLTSASFSICTWHLMRSSDTVHAKVMNCAALAAVLTCDEAIYESWKFNEPGLNVDYVTPWHLCRRERDAKDVVETADNAVWVVHFALVTAILVGAVAYII